MPFKCAIESICEEEQMHVYKINKLNNSVLQGTSPIALNSFIEMKDTDTMNE